MTALARTRFCFQFWDFSIPVNSSFRLFRCFSVFFAFFSVTKRSLELIFVSQGPVNFDIKTKKCFSKKVDLVVEIFSFQDFWDFRFFEILRIFDFSDFFFKFWIFRFLRFENFEEQNRSKKVFFDRPIFFEKVGKNPDTNIEVKFHCGSNGSTLSLWKWFQNHYNA